MMEHGPGTDESSAESGEENGQMSESGEVLESGEVSKSDSDSDADSRVCVIWVNM